MSAVEAELLPIAQQAPGLLGFSWKGTSYTKLNRGLSADQISLGLHSEVLKVLLKAGGPFPSQVSLRHVLMNVHGKVPIMGEPADLRVACDEAADCWRIMLRHLHELKKASLKGRQVNPDLNELMDLIIVQPEGEALSEQPEGAAGAEQHGVGAAGAEQHEGGAAGAEQHEGGAAGAEQHEGGAAGAEQPEAGAEPELDLQATARLYGLAMEDMPIASMSDSEDVVCLDDDLSLTGMVCSCPDCSMEIPSAKKGGNARIPPFRRSLLLPALGRIN